MIFENFGFSGTPYPTSINYDGCFIIIHRARDVRRVRFAGGVRGVGPPCFFLLTPLLLASDRPPGGRLDPLKFITHSPTPNDSIMTNCPDPVSTSLSPTLSESPCTDIYIYIYIIWQDILFYFFIQEAAAACLISKGFKLAHRAMMTNPSLLPSLPFHCPLPSSSTFSNLI